MVFREFNVSNYTVAPSSQSNRNYIVGRKVQFFFCGIHFMELVWLTLGRLSVEFICIPALVLHHHQQQKETSFFYPRIISSKNYVLLESNFDRFHVRRSQQLQLPETYYLYRANSRKAKKIVR